MFSYFSILLSSIDFIPSYSSYKHYNVTLTHALTLKLCLLSSKYICYVYINILLMLIVIKYGYN